MDLQAALEFEFSACQRVSFQKRHYSTAFHQRMRLESVVLLDFDSCRGSPPWKLQPSLFVV